VPNSWFSVLLVPVVAWQLHFKTINFAATVTTTSTAKIISAIL
jgi:hypothetical protein